MTHGVWARGRRLADVVLSWVVAAAMGALVLDVLWGVASRYALGAQSPWTDELATTLLIWISMLGAALVYGERGHLGVDYLVGKLDPAAQRATHVAVHALVLAFAAGVLVYGGWYMTERTLASGQLLPALGLPKGYTYVAVPVSGVFLCFYALDGMIDSDTARRDRESSKADEQQDSTALPPYRSSALDQED